MIMSRFRSMGLAAGAAASVLSCYMVSLRVARERGEVQRIEQQIAATHRDIRDLQTELGTRGRMRQLERWNSDVLALTAPGAAQYLSGSVELASYQPVTVEAPATETTAVAAAAEPAAPAKAIPAVEVKPAAASEPRLVLASYTPKAATKKDDDDKPLRTASAKPKPEKKAKAKTRSKDADAGPVRLASAKAKAAKKAKGTDAKLLRTASASSKNVAKASKASEARLVRTASFKPRSTSKSGGPNAGLIHTASYVTTRKSGPTRVALLDDRVLSDIGRAAAHEKSGRKAAQ
jgi:hypothetical protein